MTDRPIVLSKDLSMPVEAVTETFAVIANRGGGKSATVRRFVEQLYKTGLPVVVLDVKGDWWGIRTSRNGKGPGLPFVIFGGDHADVPLEPTAGELIADLVVDERVPAIVDMSSMSKTQARRFATDFAERLYRRSRAPLMVVCEESDVLLPQRSTSDTARLLGAMEDIGKRGRSRGLGLVLVTQRPQEVAKSVLDLMETVILLRMTGPRSIKAVRDWISVNADADETSARDVVGSLPTLAVGEAWVWSPAFLSTVTRTRVSMFETFDSHATPRPGEQRAVPRGRADIDLAKLGAEILATAERARQADPRQLRSRVAELERGLAAAATTVETQAALIADLRARPPEVVTEVVAPAGLSQALASALDAVRAAARLVDAGGAERAEVRAVQVVAAPPPRRTGPTTGAARAGRPPAPATTDGGEVRLTKAQRAVLSALAPYSPRPRTKRQVAMLAGYAGNGGGFNNALSGLRTAGYMVGASDALTITEGGLIALGPYEPLPTGAALLEHWLAQLARAPRLILAELAAVWPEPLSKVEVAQRTQYEPGGGGFNNAISRLRTLDLITGAGGELRAADDLMAAT